jgi:hypothetical protein
VRQKHRKKGKELEIELLSASYPLKVSSERRSDVNYVTKS